MIYFFLFIASLFLTYIIKNIAIKKSLLDVPNERSSHSVATPYGGGISMAIVWFFGLFYLYVYDMIERDIYLALLLGFIISFVSFFDDIYDLSPKIRLTIQFLVSGFSLYLLGGLQQMDFYFFTVTNQILTNTFALFMMVWFINLYNFLDGLDGYAGSEAIFLGIAGYLLFGDSLFLVLISSVGGFLIWNWEKAKIFMGDVGSTMLGYNVAVFAVYYQNKDNSFVVWMILFGLFWFDATLTLYRRYRNSENLSQAHKKHAYQRLNQSGWKHSKVVRHSFLINLVLFGFAFLAYSYRDLSIVMLLVAIMILYAIVLKIDKKEKFIC